MTSLKTPSYAQAMESTHRRVAQLAVMLMSDWTTRRGLPSRGDRQGLCARAVEIVQEDMTAFTEDGKFGRVGGGDGVVREGFAQTPRMVARLAAEVATEIQCQEWRDAVEEEERPVPAIDEVARTLAAVIVHAAAAVFAALITAPTSAHVYDLTDAEADALDAAREGRLSVDPEAGEFGRTWKIDGQVLDTDGDWWGLDHFERVGMLEVGARDGDQDRGARLTRFGEQMLQAHRARQR